MLQFFRKYQKIIFIFSAVTISISFVFFGTFSNLLSQQSADRDVNVGKLIDGKPLRQKKLHGMIQFISSSVESLKFR